MRRLGLAFCVTFAASVAQAGSILYTFANTGTSPYTFSFFENNILTTAGTFAITPFTVDGFTFTQAALGVFPTSYCFVFGTAGANPVSGGPSSCSVTALPGEAGLQSTFAGPPNTIGVYTTSSDSGVGGIPTAQGANQLTISSVPEPGTFLLLGSAICAFGIFRKGAGGKRRLSR
jgi:hypothetical protein